MSNTSKNRFKLISSSSNTVLEFVMIPQTLDQVSIGTMDLAKVDNKKHVYMVGMNDGVMPSICKISEVGLNSTLPRSSNKRFSSSVIKLEDDKGCGITPSFIPTSPTSDILQMDEAFVCYIAMTRACEQMTFSYSLMEHFLVPLTNVFLHQ
jgi:ATP-dependent helicase/nuclease subunit B